MDKSKKCVVCLEKNAWVISPTITNIPVYCRKCYCEKILKLKYLNRFCDKCGHKINTLSFSIYFFWREIILIFTLLKNI